MTDSTVYLLTIDEPGKPSTYTTTAYTNRAAADEDAATWQKIDRNQGKETTYRVVALGLSEHAKWNAAPDGKAGVPK